MPTEREKPFLRAASRRRAASSSRKPQLAHSSWEDSGSNSYDADGTLMSRFAKQFDGTHTAASLSGPQPPQPSTADVTAGPVSLTVRWDGRFAGDALSPMDLKQVEVVVDGVTKGEVVGELGSGLVVSPLPVRPHTVTLVARSQSGKASAASIPVVVTPKPPVQTINTDGSLRTQVSEDEGEESFLTFGEAAIGPTGDTALPSLAVATDPEFMGKKLLGRLAEWDTPSPTEAWLDQLPRGIVTTGKAPSHNDGITDGEMGLLQLNFQTETGRNYRIHVEPLSVYVNPTAAVPNPFGHLRIRENHGDSPANPVYADGLWRQQAVRRADSGLHMFPFGGSWLLQSFQDVEYRMLFSLHSDGDMDIIDSTTAGDATVWVEDIGPNVADTSITRASYRKYNADPEPPPPTDDAPEKHVYERYAASTRSFSHGGAQHYIFDESKLFQGQSPAGYGDLRCMVIFPEPNIPDAANIVDAWLEVYFDHWWRSGGGTAHFGLHGFNTLQSSLNSVNVHWSKSFNRNQQRRMKIPQHLWDGLKGSNPTWRGFTMTGNTLAEYGYANAFGSRQPRLHIEYRQ